MFSGVKRFIASHPFMKSRLFAITVLSSVTAVMLLIVSAFVNVVYVRDGENIQTLYTLNKDYASIVSQVDVNNSDKVEFTGFTGNVAELVIHRPISVTVVDAGVETKYTVVDSTVEDVLKTAKIEVRDNDLINIPLSEPITSGVTIEITRIDSDTRIEEIEIPFETTYIDDPLRAKGTEVVKTEGVDGLQVKKYEQKIVDGTVSEEVLVSDEIESEPINKVVAVGIGTADSYSQLTPSDNIEFDENGIPTNYTRVMSNAVATAYSAYDGALTASGRYAIIGHVAVDPDIIPYGTEMFITSSDGRLNYGYCIAADTGIALNEGIIDVDLFFGSYEESCNWGKRNVNIYIFD